MEGAEGVLWARRLGRDTVVDPDQQQPLLRLALRNIQTIQRNAWLVVENGVRDVPSQSVDQALIDFLEESAVHVAAEVFLHHPLARGRR